MKEIAGKTEYPISNTEYPTDEGKAKYRAGQAILQRRTSRRSRDGYSLLCFLWIKCIYWFFHVPLLNTFQ